MDYSSEAIKVYPKKYHTEVECQQLQHMVEEVYNNKPHIGVIPAVNEISEECAIPEFGPPMAARKLWG